MLSERAGAVLKSFTVARADGAQPVPTLSLVDAVAIIVGIVIGAGIFRTPSLVAANAGSVSGVLAVWLIGGVISLIGALCYMELATTYPHAGGDYHYLTRAFGKAPAFLFAWSRITVIQSGSLALLAFVFGDYATQLFSLGSNSPGVYAALLVLLLTALNIAGVRQSTRTQNLLTALEISCVVVVIFSGLVLISLPAVPETAATAVSSLAPAAETPPAIGLALVFVLLTYGGWNEAAYISAEIGGGRRNMAWALLLSIGIITTLYMLVNWAYLRGLGTAGVAGSEAVAADLMRRAAGERGAQFVSLVVAVSALTSANATIFTGARTNYALGRDFKLFEVLGRWHGRANTPANALAVQALIALGLILIGVLTRRGFATMVEYTAPVFWLFFLLTGVSLIVLRAREPQVRRPFRVPLYPVVPLMFCAVCVYMLASSIAYTGVGAMVGVVVLATGVPVLYLAGRWQLKTLPFSEKKR